MTPPAIVKELEPHTLEPLISQTRVENRVLEMGLKTSRDLWGDNPIIVALLYGGKEFDTLLTDILTLDKLKYRRGTIRVSSYGKNTKSNGKPNITQDIDIDVEGQVVVLNEDIYETGGTLAYTLAHLYKKKGAKRVLINTLLDKPLSHVVNVPIYQNGFVIPEKFAVGTGIGWGEHYRTLTGIWLVNKLASSPNP